MLTLQDQELSFGGPARAEVVHAWRTRFDRMRLLRNFCGTNFEQVREEFLGCLMRADHSSVAKVYCCSATKPTDPCRRPTTGCSGRRFAPRLNRCVRQLDRRSRLVGVSARLGSRLEGFNMV